MTLQELEDAGPLLTWDEDMRYELAEYAEREKEQAMNALLSPNFQWKDMGGSWSLNWFQRVWYWLKAIISLSIGYRVSLWAHPDSVDVAAWDFEPSHCEYSGYDWVEINVRTGWKLGYDIFRNSSY